MSRETVKQALEYGSKELRGVKIDSARLDAEILLCFVLGFSREKLFLNNELRIKNNEWKKFQGLIKRRKKHEPVAYLIGKKEFYGIDFKVNRDVLVPRPETETLIDEVLNFVKTNPKKLQATSYKLTEIGTGSGCIALTLAKYLPKAKITAVDISGKALQVARKNRVLVGNGRDRSLQNVKFFRSNLLSKVKTRPDIIVANLPYLDNDIKTLLRSSDSKGLKFEPQIALRGGPDGLDVYRRLFQQVRDKGWTDIVIFIEIDEAQTRPLKKYVLDLFPNASVGTKKDLAGRDRVMAIKL